jgi:hypothetical protein
MPFREWEEEASFSHVDDHALRLRCIDHRNFDFKTQRDHFLMILIPYW